MVERGGEKKENTHGTLVEQHSRITISNRLLPFKLKTGTVWVKKAFWARGTDATLPCTPAQMPAQAKGTSTDTQQQTICSGTVHITTKVN